MAQRSHLRYHTQPLSQIPVEELDAQLQRLYEEAAPPLPKPFVPGPEDWLDKPGSPRHVPPSPEDGLRLDQLPTDALSELYEHVSLPFVLKLVCRALRNAGPKRTETTLSHIAQSSWRLQWAFSNGCPFEWGPKLAAKMARHGCLHALLWGHHHMLRWDKETPNQAARHGHLEVLERVHKAGCPAHMNEVAHEAVLGGHMNVLEWIGFWHSQVFRNHLMTQTACEYGHLEVLKWLRSHRCPWNTYCLASAAKNGHMAILEWAPHNGATVSLSGDEIANAAKNGHLHAIIWMRERGWNLDARACANAADGGYLEVLQYLRSGYTPCKWDNSTCTLAAKSGHLRILHWALTNECPYDQWWLWAAAARMGQVHVLRYLAASGFTTHEVRRDAFGYSQASINKYDRTRNWLTRMRSPWQRVRNAVRAVAIGRYWWKLCQ